MQYFTVSARQGLFPKVLWYISLLFLLFFIFPFSLYGAGDADISDEEFFTLHSGTNNKAIPKKIHLLATKKI